MSQAMQQWHGDQFTSFIEFGPAMAEWFAREDFDIQ